jgi:protein-S-isoprenylcysteine O-methyltransferase Ste14
MTESASTPRLRATFAIYLALVAATAVVGPREIPAGWHYLAGLGGFMCVALACLGRIWTSLFIAGHKDEVLVTTGPYALCRHPLYSFSVLGALGLGLTSRSALLCIAVVILIMALVVYAAACEEQFLADAYPDEFKA